MAERLEQLAERILQSPNGRVKKIDKRSIPFLRRHGLLQYPDGYSLTAHAMEKALLFFQGVLREAERHKTPKEEYLRDLVEKAERWVASHQRTPDLRKLRFGDLSFDQYHVLWEAVTENGVATELYSKRWRESLIRKGYIIYADFKGNPVPEGANLYPTDKGRKLVVEQGDPYMAQRVASRFAALT